MMNIRFENDLRDSIKGSLISAQEEGWGAELIESYLDNVEKNYEKSVLTVMLDEGVHRVLIKYPTITRRRAWEFMVNLCLGFSMVNVSLNDEAMEKYIDSTFNHCNMRHQMYWTERY